MVPGYKKRKCASNMVTEHPKERSSVNEIEAFEERMLTCNECNKLSENDGK